MKQLCLCIFTFLLITVSLSAINIIPVGSRNDVQLVTSSTTGLTLRYDVDKIESFDVTTKGGVFSSLNIAGYSSTTDFGSPALPLNRRLIAVPLGATVDFQILNSTYEEYNLQAAGINHLLMPAQPSVSKSSDPARLPFSFEATAYKSNTYNNKPLVHVVEIGIMRGVRVFAVDFEPVYYNPQAKKIKVCNAADVQITFHKGDLYASEQLRMKTYSPAFEGIYAKSLINNTEINDRSSNLRSPMGYLIISGPALSSTMSSFVTWKKQQGYNVTIVTTATTGTTTTAIKAYIQNIWNNATVSNPAPSFLLFVGDTAEIPAFTGQTASGHVTDLDYAKLNGTDFVPDIYYGRFSASTTTDLQNIINKTLMFEKTTMPSTAYLGFVDMIAGNDATYGLDYGDGQINYGTNNYFNIAHGITSSTYLYAVSGNSSTATAIHGDVNTGRGYLNYTAHGSEDGWYMPSFLTADVDNLTNANKYPVMVGNCCLTNHFDTAICFGEKLIRAANKGAAGYIGANNYSYWNEDYWWGVGAKNTQSQITAANGVAPAWSSGKIGAYDAVFHEHSEASTDWATFLGSMIFMGNLAVTQEASSLTTYYWEVYSIMGDPSLSPYMGVPAVNNVTAPSTVNIGQTTYSLTAAANSYACLSLNGVIYGVGTVNGAGSLSMTITPFTAPGTADLVITCQNKVTYISTVTIASDFCPPQTLTAIAKNGCVQLSWVLPIVGTPSSYTVYRNSVAIASGITALTYTNTGLTNGVSYSFYVTATYTSPSNGESVPSNTVISSPVAAVPTNLTAIPGSMHVTLNWTAPTSQIPDGYKIYRNSILLTTTPVIGTTYSDNTVIDDITYSYYVTSVFNTPVGESLPSNSVNATPTSSLLITIGTGATTSRYPIASYRGFERSANLFTSTEIGNFGFIKTLAWNPTVTTTSNVPIRIYLKTVPTTTTTLTASRWATMITGATQVFNGTVAGTTANVWNVIDITDFSYTSGNLLVFVQCDYGSTGDGGTTTGAGYCYSITSGNKAENWGSNNTEPVSNGTISTQLPNIRMALLTNPVFSANTSNLDFGAVESGQTTTRQFTITNLGGQILTGNITTPAGYSVGQATKNILSYSIPIGNSGTFTVTFNPTAVQSYNGTISITSNDTNHPLNEISVVGTGYVSNHAPTINLPAAFSFNRNCSLVQDFNSFIHDDDADQLTITYSGNNHIHAAVNGYQVSFTVDENWMGTENITFNVDDGHRSVASDIVAVTVNPINCPTWTPVVYPNLQVVLYTSVTIDDTDAEAGDIISAWINGECRGTAVLEDAREVCASLSINVAEDGELVYFKLYDASNDEVFDATNTITVNIGETQGSTVDPIPVDVITVVEAPVNVNIHAQSSNFSITWPVVANANTYYVYRSDTLGGTYSCISTVHTNSYLDTSALGRACFYYVTAEKNNNIK